MDLGEKKLGVQNFMVFSKKMFKSVYSRVQRLQKITNPDHRGAKNARAMLLSKSDKNDLTQTYAPISRISCHSAQPF